MQEGRARHLHGALGERARRGRRSTARSTTCYATFVEGTAARAEGRERSRRPTRSRRSAESAARGEATFVTALRGLPRPQGRRQGPELARHRPRARATCATARSSTPRPRPAPPRIDPLRRAGHGHAAAGSTTGSRRTTSATLSTSSGASTGKPQRSRSMPEANVSGRRPQRRTPPTRAPSSTTTRRRSGSWSAPSPTSSSSASSPS